MTVQFDKTLDDIKLFMKENGFYFTEAQIYDFYVSLKTKPFVILSGISGSGKSKIADLFAEYMSKAYTTSNNYELISVKPNWTDGRGIFGYHNILDNTYAITPAIKLFIRALNNPDKPYFLVLDEMNLAKVEYYFSDFLSLIESRRLKKGSDKYIFNESKLQEATTLSLPKVTLLAAIDMNLFEKRAGIDSIRHNRIYRAWMEAHSSEVERTNWTPRSRTEINSKDSTTGIPDRVSPKFFKRDTNNDELYRLVNNNELSELRASGIITDANYSLWTQLLSDYFILQPGEYDEIHQDEMILHNENIALPASGEIAAVGIENKSYANLFDEDNNIYFVPQKLPIPLNVFVIGTVNVDETTYMFSPKVLDRSNVMEFNHVDLYHAYHYGEVEPHQIAELPGVSALPFDLRIKLATSKDTKDFTTLYPTEFRVLVDIFKVLAEQNLHFGYRVFNEISRFVLNFCGNQAGAEEVLAALDIQILQKVLPKLNGSDDEIGDTLKKIMEISGNHNLLRTVRKISRMSDSLTRLGYATYIE